MSAISQESTIKAALPYLATTAAMVKIGNVIATSRITSTALKIASVVLFTFGVMSFLATAIYTIVYWNNPKVFKQKVPKYIKFVFMCWDKKV